jgi:hypothetical protein
MSLKKKLKFMKHNFHLLLLLICFSSFAQEIKDSEQIEKPKTKRTFLQFDASIPFAANIHRGETYADGSKNTTWFLPNGFSGKFGFGIQQNKWIGVSLHTGIDWKINEKLVAVPLFGNLRISPLIGEATRLTLQAGYGKGFALGRGNLVGTYQKYSIGIENDEDTMIFAEISGYDFKINNNTATYSFSLGIALRTF